MASLPPGQNSTVSAQIASNSAAPQNNVNTTITGPSSQDQIQRLQQYAPTQRVPVQLGQPGYEILIYSRFASDPNLNLYGPNSTNNTVTVSNSNNTSYPNFTGWPTTNQVPSAGSGNPTDSSTICTPTFRFFSDTYSTTGASLITRDQNPVITNISIHQRIDNIEGSVGAIQLIQPAGVDFFTPTIGNAQPDYPDIDYHSSIPAVDGPVRVGVMDTILIRMSNNITDPTTGITSRYVETVFRGVIAEIRRVKNTTGGSTVTIQVMDFSEFLRQITALPLGAFSTVNFQLTGRNYVNNLLLYANQLYSGKSNILNVNESTIGQIGQTLTAGALTSLVDLIPSAGQLTTASNSTSSNPTHAMSLPPVFWLQYSPLDAISIENSTPANNFNGLSTNPSNAATALATSVGNAVSDLTQFVSQVIQSIKSDISAIQAGQAGKLLTPEDNESINAYSIFGATLPTAIQNSINTLFNTFNVPIPNGSISGTQLAEIAWALSDIYFEKGIISFEHERVWNTIWKAASRSLREVYFDFAPKLRPDNVTDGSASLVPFDTASVYDISQAGSQGLRDVHPNIGILKYRLSPCFIPYPPKNPMTQFRFYSFSDYNIIESDVSETEQEVFTAVFGFGFDLGKTTLTDFAMSVLSGQSQGLIATANTLDPRIESRLGFRFMSNHDETIKIPILMYLTSYALLHKSQANMFQEALIIVGDPRVQPGSIVQVQTQNSDYYCTQVLHSWDINSGYTTQLQLQYGHTTGTFPTVVSGFTADVNQSTANSCTLSGMQMQKEGINSGKTIGGINQDCLVYALQQYMSNVTSTTINPIIASPSQISGSGKLTDQQLQSLWINAGGDPSLAPIMAWIALGESGGNPNLVNQDDKGPGNNYQGQISAGLWQCSAGVGQPELPNAQDPATNAMYAVGKLKSQGLCKAWGVCGNISPSNLPDAYAQINNRYDGQVGPLLGNNPNLAASPITTANWPYKVYGPIGMQLTSYNKGPNGSSNSSTYQSQLTSATTGIPYAQAYIGYLSNKYATANFSPQSYQGALPGSDFSAINQSDTLAKVIAAWYCDDGSAPTKNFNPGFMNQVIQQVKSLYSTCTACQAAAVQPLNASSPAELQAGSTNRQALINSGKLAFQHASDQQDILTPFNGKVGTTDSLIQMLSYLTQQKGWNIVLTAVNQDHSYDSPNGHSGGKAVDCFPGPSGPSAVVGQYLADNAIGPFLSDCVSVCRQIGLGGSTQSYPNYLQIISPLGGNGFPDGENSVANDHIHLGV